MGRMGENNAESEMRKWGEEGGNEGGGGDGE